MDKRRVFWGLALIAAGIAYALFPLDFIPDALLPLGLVDDAAIVLGTFTAGGKLLLSARGRAIKSGDPRRSLEK